MSAGEQHIEIDRPNIPSNLDSAELARQIADIAENYVVDVKSVSPGLIKK
jgi:hypothetical protein